MQFSGSAEKMIICISFPGINAHKQYISGLLKQTHHTGKLTVHQEGEYSYFPGQLSESNSELLPILCAYGRYYHLICPFLFRYFLPVPSSAAGCPEPAGGFRIFQCKQNVSAAPGDPPNRISTPPDSPLHNGEVGTRTFCSSGSDTK